MRILVTAGNTLVPIDRVRCLTNVFTGRTGARIALHAFLAGHGVQLLTSHPEVMLDLRGTKTLPGERLAVQSYRTFDDLHDALAEHLRAGSFDALIHTAAVSDYLSEGVFAPAPGTRFGDNSTWRGEDGTPPRFLDRSAGKVKSDEPELWLRLVRAPKLVDKVRAEWSFRGVLVKFKLEVGLGSDQLLDIAERSRHHSRADLMVANTLEEADSWAFLGPLNGGYLKVPRQLLAARLITAIETLHKERSLG
jgi:phosphopantothenoylcysteine synthetase/decarboxylase